MVEQKTNHS